jgi:hypothetical protein
MSMTVDVSPDALSSADRRPHTGPRQCTRVRVHLLPHPSTSYLHRSCVERGRNATKLILDPHGLRQTDEETPRGRRIPNRDRRSPPRCPRTTPCSRSPACWRPPPFPSTKSSRSRGGRAHSRAASTRATCRSARPRACRGSFITGSSSQSVTRRATRSCTGRTVALVAAASTRACSLRWASGTSTRTVSPTTPRTCRSSCTTSTTGPRSRARCTVAAQGRGLLVLR